MCSTRHLRRGVNDGGGTTTRVAGRNCEIVADDHLDPLLAFTRERVKLPMSTRTTVRIVHRSVR